MKCLFPILLLLCSCLSSTLQAQTASPKLTTWQDLMQLPTPAPGQKIAYGTDSAQFGELRLPAEGNGPFPVVVVIHGGCWLAQYNYQYMNHLSAALTKAGYATWNLEFRRVGNPGGGWPGTFLDVASGVDYVRQLAREYPVSAKDVVVMGHSAGGHLALWAAGRRDLPKRSAIYTKNPLKIKGVVSLAGIPDLAAYAQGTGSCNTAVEKLMGGLPGQMAQRYTDATPTPKGTRKSKVRLLQGQLDPIVPVSQASEFADKAAFAGYDAKMLLLPQAGHFDLVSPVSDAYKTIEQTVRELFAQ